MGAGLWGPIIAQIIAALIGLWRNRAQNAGSGTSYAAHAEAQFTKKEVRRLAKKIVEAQPELNLACVEQVLPAFLRDLADVVGPNMLANPKAFIGLALKHVTALLQCQFGLTAQASNPLAQAQLKANILECAVAALVFYFTNGQDIAKAVSQFFSCVVGGLGGGGGTDDGEQPSPSGYVGTPYDRGCGGASQSEDSAEQKTEAKKPTLE